MAMTLLSGSPTIHPTRACHHELAIASLGKNYTDDTFKVHEYVILTKKRVKNEKEE